MKDSLIKFVVISDIHYSPNIDWSNVIWKYTPNEEIPCLLKNFIEILINEIKPDCVFELGDRIIDVDHIKDIENTKSVMAMLDDKLRCPCFHVFGNHDIKILDKDIINSIFRIQYGLPHSFVFKGFKVILLDSLDPMVSGVGGTISKEQQRWLRKQMNEDNYPKLVFSHHPLNYHEINNNKLIPTETLNLMYVENYTEVKNILENGKNFLIHTSAHMHWFSLINNLKGKYLVNPAFSAAFPEKTNAPGWFLEISINTDLDISIKIHSVNPRRIIGNLMI